MLTDVDLSHYNLDSKGKQRHEFDDITCDRFDALSLWKCSWLLRPASIPETCTHLWEMKASVRFQEKYPLRCPGELLLKLKTSLWNGGHLAESDQGSFVMFLTTKQKFLLCEKIENWGNGILQKWRRCSYSVIWIFLLWGGGKQEFYDLLSWEMG